MARPIKECEVEKLVLYFCFSACYKIRAGNSVRTCRPREIRTSNNNCVAVNMFSSSLKHLIALVISTLRQIEVLF